MPTIAGTCWLLLIHLLFLRLPGTCVFKYISKQQLACLPLCVFYHCLSSDSVTSWRPSFIHLFLIQPASACSPTQFAIKTKFRALKPEGRWVSAQGTCCLATKQPRGTESGGWTSAIGGGVGLECVYASVCVSAGHLLALSATFFNICVSDSQCEIEIILSLSICFYCQHFVT